MRNIIWILVAIVIAAGAYWLFTGQSPRDLAIRADEAETAPEADPVVDEPAVETVTDTAPAADDAADQAAEDAAAEEDPATDVTEDATTGEEPATDATDGAAAEEVPGTEPAGDATETDAETDTTETDTAETGTADTATDTAAADDPQELLTVDGFDFERVNEMIENSDLDPAQKTSLASELEQAQDSPELLGDVLDRIRDALDL